VEIRDGSGLRVFALGPLRAEQDGKLVVQWGGAKAGSRQAEAVFAFLFDRGDRGVAKDELVDLIWPDVAVDRADVAFHRTLSGLRRTLDPARTVRSGRADGAVVFYNDRYHLQPGVVAWSDTRAFEEAFVAASTADTHNEAIRALETARELYRGEYLDDCPFYGDSADVEERRSQFRGRYVDLLVALGQRYETLGDRPGAAAAFREAVATSLEGCAPAADGLERLQALP
jgi:two-component SAPR family response regulator